MRYINRLFTYFYLLTHVKRRNIKSNAEQVQKHCEPDYLFTVTELTRLTGLLH